MQGSHKTQLGGRDVTMVSWNVRGLGHAVKRDKVFRHLKSLSADVIFLQETHIKPTEQRRLRCGWVSQVYQSPFTSHARGVAILFRKNIPFQLTFITADPHGRYIMVSGTINAFPLTLLNVYGPNVDNPNFFKKVFDLLPNESNSNIIIGGDLNCYLDPYLDRLSSRPPSNIASVPILNNLVKSRNLVDIWRIQHPTQKDYSFFSHVHKSYSRIDYFLVDTQLIPHVTNAKYHNILISDHSPLTMSINLSLPKQTYSWRFNPSLLSDDKFIKYITSQLKDFLETNDNGEVSDNTLWETLKVVIRGYIISYESILKKEREARLSEIESILSSLEGVYQTSKSVEDYNKIMKLKYEYNCILGGQINNLLLKLRQKHFELGDKPERLLARQLKGAQASRSIHCIKSKTGALLTNPKEINDCFKKFYSELYSSKCCPSHSDLNAFFDSIVMPKLTDAAKKDLDSDFTLDEIKSAIKSFSSGKAAGPDGFGCEFYKRFCDTLAPLLLRMSSASKSGSALPKTLYEANISIILKKGREETDPASYRPIALQNFDRKVITKLLANRLNRYLSTIIHPDQTGFIPGRYSFSNVRRLLNTIYAGHDKIKGAGILSLDAQKAFDQVEWPYMFESLRRFGFGDSFISWVKLMYADPVCSILTNGDRSATFPLHRSVQQGCPLSPALFAIALEPLALSIRGHPNILGLTVGGEETLISLYADDVILYLQNSEESVPCLLELITSFGKLSGYTINWTKSEFMPLSDNYTPGFLENTPFKIVKNHLNYLGLNIPKDAKLIFKLNFDEFISSLKQCIENWKILPLSMIGRINSIKMVSLPRFLYLCQNLPIFLTAAFFKELDSIILSYVWNYKNHRISKIHLQKPKSEGGLGLPSYKHYYWAANARALMFWHYGSPDSLAPGAPLWLRMESGSVTKSSLPALLFTKLDDSKILKSLSFTLRNSVKILSQIRGILHLPETSAETPICFNHSFMPPWSDRTFHAWREKGLISIGDLYEEGQFMSFNLLREKFDLPHSHFFRYLQIRHYVQSKLSKSASTPENHAFFDILKAPPRSRHLISKFVNLFDGCCMASCVRIREAWEEELGVELVGDVWDGGLSAVRACSVNSRHQLIQYKVIHRLHYSKQRLHRIYPSVSPTCDRCQTSVGTLSHAFWFCPSLSELWSGVFDWYSGAYKISLPLDAILAIFGCSQLSQHFPTATQQALMLGMTVAKRLILREWKSPSSLPFQRWMKDMINVIRMEKLRFTRTNSLKKFSDIWGPFLAHLDNNSNTDLSTQ